MLNILAAEVLLHEETARQCVVWHRKSRTEGARSTWLWITGCRYRNRTAWQGGCLCPPKSWAAVDFLRCAKVDLDLRRCFCLQEATEMLDLASKHWHQSGRQSWRIEGKLGRSELFSKCPALMPSIVLMHVGWSHDWEVTLSPPHWLWRLKPYLWLEHRWKEAAWSAWVERNLRDRGLLDVWMSR